MENLTEIKRFLDVFVSLRVAIKQYVVKKIREDNIDLTYEMLQVLGVLWANGEMNQQEIADRTQKNKASLTSLLDNLAKRDFIIRTEDLNDRRNKIISLTKTGREKEQYIAPVLRDLHNTLGSNLNKAEIKQLTDILEKMKANVV